jgi:hypothetical protein
MKKIALFAFSLFFSFNLPAQAAQPVSVVELFTSQGCSSCPPADAFLGKLSMRPDVLALAYHVDYWDYIGWKDPYAKSEFTQRQRDYAHHFNLRYVYTPQMVVAGRYQDSGTQQKNILNALEKDLSRPHPITLHFTPSGLSIDGVTQDDALNIFLGSYHKEQTTQVRRGENRGRNLTNYNIVQSLQKLGIWSGGPATFPLKNHTSPAQGQGIFLQHPESLEIIAALRLD